MLMSYVSQKPTPPPLRIQSNEHVAKLRLIMKGKDDGAVEQLVAAMAADFELAKAVGDLVSGTVDRQGKQPDHRARHGSEVLVNGRPDEALVTLVDDTVSDPPTAAPTTVSSTPAATIAATLPTPAPTAGATFPTLSPTAAAAVVTPAAGGPPPPPALTLMERLSDGGHVVMGHMGYCESRYGFCTNVAENTIDAAQKCLGLCDGIEIDVAQSKDGHWLLMHDDDARRVTDIDPGDNTWVQNQPWEKLKQLNVVKNEKRNKRKCESPYNCPVTDDGNWFDGNHYEGPPVPIGEFEPVLLFAKEHGYIVEIDIKSGDMSSLVPTATPPTAL